MQKAIKQDSYMSVTWNKKKQSLLLYYTVFPLYKLHSSSWINIFTKYRNILTAYFSHPEMVPGHQMGLFGGIVEGRVFNASPLMAARASRGPILYVVCLALSVRGWVLEGNKCGKAQEFFWGGDFVWLHFQFNVNQFGKTQFNLNRKDECTFYHKDFISH